jgi:pimeloyl-ACP methyl ester carboxylesterase
MVRWSDNAVALVSRPQRCVLVGTPPQLPADAVRCGPQIVAPPANVNHQRLSSRQPRPKYRRHHRPIDSAPRIWCDEVRACCVSQPNESGYATDSSSGRESTMTRLEHGMHTATVHTTRGWDATFDRTAASLDNPDHVTIVIHNYRWRLGLAEGEPAYDALENRLAAGPVITVPTITLEGDANGAPHPAPAAYAAKFSGKYVHRNLTGGIGHNLPQEAPKAFADAVIDVDAL